MRRRSGARRRSNSISPSVFAASPGSAATSSISAVLWARCTGSFPRRFVRSRTSVSRRCSARCPSGLVLVTGPTGSGKSTTLAAMLDKINTERHDHILTIEDPIEYIHPHKNCLVNQREVHADTQSFSAALRAALREDPDIVLIGEMRDLETVEAALKIAETGHLTFGTLHTNSAASTINRIIDVFPAHQQSQIRAQL